MSSPVTTAGTRRAAGPDEKSCGVGRWILSTLFEDDDEDKIIFCGALFDAVLFVAGTFASL